MASSAEETQKMRDAAAEAKENFTAISDIMAKNLATTRKSREVMDKVNSNLKGQISLEDQLTVLEQEKQEYLEEQLKGSKIINEDLIKRFDLSIDLLRKEKDRKDISEGIRDAMLGQLGFAGELVSKFIELGKKAVLLLIIAKIAQYLGDAVKRSIELTQQTGMSAGQAAKYEANIRRAQFSVDGMLLGFDKLNASAGELVKLTGSINISPDTIKGTAALNELLGDQGAAARLQRSFEVISDDADVFRESIEDIATKQGVDARVAFEALSQEGARLNSLSEQQVKKLAEEAVLIKQMGVDRAKAVDIAGQALDIESSLAQQMKLQQITGQNLTGEFEALRAAQLSGDPLKVAAAQRDLALKTADAAGTNLQFQRMVNQALGMEDAERQNIITAAQKGNDLSKEGVAAIKEQGGSMSDFGINALVVLGTLGAMVGIFYAIKAMGGLSGILGGVGKGMGRGLMQMSVGLASLANPATLLGLGALTVALIGIGFALKLAAPGFEALGKAMAAIVKSIGGALSNIITSIGDVFVKVAQVATPQIALSLMGMAAGFAALSASLATFAIAGMAAIPSMIAVGTFASIGGAELLGGGEDNSNDDLVKEIKGLRSDIQSQPILISVDGKVVSEITKVQSRQGSFSRQMGRG